MIKYDSTTSRRYYYLTLTLINIVHLLGTQMEHSFISEYRKNDQNLFSFRVDPVLKKKQEIQENTLIIHTVVTNDTSNIFYIMNIKTIYV